MKLLTLMLIFMTAIEYCKPEDEPYTTIVLHDTRTEMTVKQVNETSRSRTDEFFDSLRESENEGNDLDFDYDDGEDVKTNAKESEMKEQEMQEVLLKAMRKPAIRKQIGEVIPILRVMSPAQRLALAALVSSQIMSQNTLNESNLAGLAAVFGGKNIANPDDRHNITEHLLLPISMDIAKMFKGLGQEMGRSLRQNFYRPRESLLTENRRKMLMQKSNKPQPAINRRMDDFDSDEPEEKYYKSGKPIAEPLKQPGIDECDYFTISLCLEVSNYPTEAIISSLRKNQNITKTFLTDFDVPKEKSKSQARFRSDRRKDTQNEIQEPPSEGSYMCPSSVKYARPKRARATSGQWKYIVNAGDYTQTLRLEICQKPKSPCSYVTNHLNSQCAQVYNYHRLLTWDENNGLHMDIFKVPSCCSCHIQGYSTFFPPNNDFAYAEKRKEPSDHTELIGEHSKPPPLGLSPEHSFYSQSNSAGSKREVTKPVPLGIPPIAPVKNSQHFSFKIKDFPENPVDHLVPPGPPLPLEKEIMFSPKVETLYYQKKGPLEIRKFPAPTEQIRPVNKATERVEVIESEEGHPLTTKTRINPLALQPKPSPRIPQTHHSNLPREPNPIFDSSNQIPILRPALNTPPPFANSEIKVPKPNEDELFVTPNPGNDLTFYYGSKSNPVKSNPKSSPQYFNPEPNDVKGLPSKVKPFYVTPPQRLNEANAKLTTTSQPPKKSEVVSSSGQRKINYNYHPIIDFFVTDSQRRQSEQQKTPYTYPPRHYLPLPSEDWIPVLGH